MANNSENLNTNTERLIYLIVKADETSKDVSQIENDVKEIREVLFIKRDDKKPLCSQVDENQEKIAELNAERKAGKLGRREIMLIAVSALLSSGLMLACAMIFRVFA